MPTKDKIFKRQLVQSRISSGPRHKKIVKPNAHRKPCPCCFNVLIRQIYLGEPSWYCRHCFQNMSTLINL